MATDIAPLTAPWATIQQGQLAGSVAPWLALLWLGGIVVNSVLISIQTWKVHRYWSRERCSTDPALLNLLEDCKATAEITAPLV